MSGERAPVAQFLMGNSHKKRVAVLAARPYRGPWRPGLAVVPTPAAGSLDVRAIRLATRGIGATQESFAKAIGVSVKTQRNWEQRRRQPTGPARVLLACIARNPWLVFDAIGPRRLDGAPHATRAAELRSTP
jgi:DNA-binding XRE family transcriptional regulator